MFVYQSPQTFLEGREGQQRVNNMAVGLLDKTNGANDPLISDDYVYIKYESLT